MGAKSYMEKLILGYIAEIEQEYRHLNIPNGIKKICLDFYKLRESFPLYGDNILVNQDKTIAMGTTTEIKGNTVYGDQIIDLTDE